MVLKKAPAVNIVLSFEYKKRLTDYMVILMAVDKRISKKRKSPGKSKKLKSQDIKARLTAGLVFLQEVVYL